MIVFIIIHTFFKQKNFKIKTYRHLANQIIQLNKNHFKIEFIKNVIKCTYT